MELYLLLCSALGTWGLSVDHEDVAAFVSQAHNAMLNRFHNLEVQLHKDGVRQKPGSPEWFMAASRSPKKNSRNFTQAALMSEETTKYMALALEVTGDELTGVSVEGTELGELCPWRNQESCEPRKYRSLSGHCNNVAHPTWGSATTAYRRFLPPNYADSISLPRGTRSKLPSAREVSLAVHTQLDREHSHLVANAAMWAQLISHDVSLTPQMTGYNGERLKCCGVDFSEFHPECFPIRVPEEDPVYGSERCQQYTRSASVTHPHCALGPREQLNEASSFIDASWLYGSSQEENDNLRAFRGGLLKLRNGLLPTLNSTDCRRSNIYKCFQAGDMRLNEHIGVAALGTILAREHNRIAKVLQELNPHWLDEILFQETRRIMISQIQYITYEEFLPLILGQETMEAHKLRLEKDGFFTGYDIDVDPSIANSVATSALHFSLSLMPTQLRIFDETESQVGVDSLADSFYAPFKLHTPRGLDTVLKSLVRTPAQSNSHHVSSTFRDHMFKQPSQNGVGLDLVAQLIQQGRDHGIPSYTAWQEFCHNKKITSFEDLATGLTPEALASISTVYTNVSDIDLLTGALSEVIPQGATVGNTFRCLLAKQFSILRKGDRHWFENDLADTGLFKEQLRAIREGSSLSRIFCDNSNLINVQPNVFLTPDEYLNAPMPCKGGPIKALDLTPWKETKPVIVLPENLLLQSFKNARHDFMAIIEQEFHLYQMNMLADPKSPMGTAFGFSRPKRQAAKIANNSLILELTSKRLLRSFLKGELQDVEANDADSLISSLPYVDLKLLDIPNEPECLESSLPCDYTTKYRTTSGWCNNLQHPEYGQSFRPFVRLLPPVYSDGVDSPRSSSVKGGALPSPRLVSSNLHTDVSRPHNRYSLFVMQFAQITDHDLTFTPVNKGFIGEGILNCKACDSQQVIHPQCFPIPIPDGDPFFPAKGPNGEGLCIPATRSMPGQKTLGPREQMNQLTAYLDLSFVYGSDTCEARALRSFKTGELNYTRHLGKQLLPETTADPECRSPSGICFKAGDARSSEQPGLGSFHTIWLREHNRIANQLSRINPVWNDEKLYQETRRILSGIYQHITYSEFLPRILGRETIKAFHLDLLQDGYFKGYDPTCDVTVFNEFSSAAFRFGHSLLRPTFRRVGPDFSVRTPPVRLRDHFFNPEVLYEPQIIDEIIMGLLDTPMETLDNFITEEVTNHLFENKTIPFSGMDLISLNIQRGRDHGVPGYNFYRQLCNLTKAVRFQDLQDTTHKALVQKLETLYKHVDDIDLFPGGMSEYPLSGAVIGPTFACIVAQQFRKIRHCDRFWYENDNAFVRFTPSQLSEIRKVTLATVLCNNVDTIETVQRHVFDLPDEFMNPRVKCDQIKSLDLSHWKDRASCVVKSINFDLGTTKNISPCVTCTCTKEGPICQSVKVKNCVTLLRTFGPQPVVDDTVCKVQCLYVFNAIQNQTKKDRSR